MALIDQLLNHLSGEPAAQIGQQLGIDQQTATGAIASALPVILGGLAKNSQSPDGAGALSKALDRDHDGSILDDLVGYATQSSGNVGDGILGHIFGGNRDKASSAVQKTSSLDAGQAAKLMMILAPIVMAYLGRKKREGGLDADGVARELESESQKHGPADTSLAGMVTSMFDKDGDGSAVDDILSKIGGSLMSRWNR